MSKTLFPESSDEVDLLPGSDHVARRVDLRLGSSDSVDPPSTSPGLYLNPKGM